MCGGIGVYGWLWKFIRVLGAFGSLWVSIDASGCLWRFGGIWEFIDGYGCL